MQQKAVAVVPPSRSNSLNCWNCKVALAASQETSAFCPNCGKILDFPTTGLNYFKIFSLPETLILDSDSLQKSFIALSKKLHPDSFVTRAHPEPQYALRWTTALNRAYQTLRNDDFRAEYILENYPLQAKLKSTVPVELAETYFELQENPDRGTLLNFKSELEIQLTLCKTEWQTLGTNWTETRDKPKLIGTLKALMDRKRYINSMLNDIERKLET